MFNQVYVFDVNYHFNEKCVDDIINWIKDDPFECNVLIYFDDCKQSDDIVKIINEISNDVWIKSSCLSMEDIVSLLEETNSNSSEISL